MRDTQKHAALLLLGFIIAALFAAPLSAKEFSVQQTLTIRSGEEFSFEVFRDPKQKPALQIFWIAPSFGIDPRHRQTAEALAKLGAEVWLIDLADALFLTRGAGTLRKIPATTIAELINALAQQQTSPSNILMLSSTYGAIPALRGVHAWQAQSTKQGRLIGTVLFSPSFFTRVPELGVAPTLIDELTATNSPLYIFQSARNGNRWHLPAVLEKLEHATVYKEILKGVMSVFYKKDISPASLAAFKKAPQMILRAARQLARHPMPTTAFSAVEKPANTGSGINTQLRTYRGSVMPTPIKLRDASGKAFNIHDYKGKVTLINFWASWCPPCVEEIPSLNRLMDKMKDKPFQLISINYAESPKQIREFLNKVNVDFPVLVDPGGVVASRWKVVAFPSTFVIGPDGKIHYGVNAGIHWDTDEIIRQLTKLSSKTKD
jgi:thiol-disulfide isomerase/thioredoxin